MKILVTGGAGFIGSHLVDRLAEKNEVVVLDNLESQVHTNGAPTYLNEQAGYIFEDIRTAETLKKAIEGVEVIFHEAAAVGVGQSMYEISKYVEVNTCATASLLHLLVNTEHEVKKLIVASSQSIYGEGAYSCEQCGPVYPLLRSENQLKQRQWEIRCTSCGRIASPVPTTESKPLNPSSIYAITKRDQEEMCLAVGKAYGLPTVALRYFNVYGPRQSLNNPYTGVCAIFSARIKNNNPPLIFEDGRQMRDFISVHDVVNANIAAMKNVKSNYEVFNVGTGRPTTIIDIASTLARLFNKTITPEVKHKYRAGDTRHCFADISKITSALGFKPKTTFDEGIQDLVAWGKDTEAVDRFEKAQKDLEQRGLVEK
jgi:dTDP-L-rhamnose 4-epimerase